MLRLVLLLLYLIASYSTGQVKTGGGLDPDGLTAQPPPSGDWGGGLDPNGLTTPEMPPGDLSGNLDPDG